MIIDRKTRAALLHQRRRLEAARQSKDRKEAAIIQRRIDQILDNRPSVHAVAPDGEVIFDDASPWVKAQTVDGEPGWLLPHGLFGSLDGEPPTESSGGVGLVDRP